MTSNFDISNARRILAKYSSSSSTSYNADGLEDESSSSRQHLPSQQLSPKPPSDAGRIAIGGGDQHFSPPSTTAPSASRKRKYLQAQLHIQQDVKSSNSNNNNESLTRHRLLNRTYRAFLRQNEKIVNDNNNNKIINDNNAANDWETVSSIIETFFENSNENNYDNNDINYSQQLHRNLISTTDLLVASKWPLTATSLTSLSLIDIADLISSAFGNNHTLKNLPWNLQCDIFTPEKVYCCSSSSGSFSYSTLNPIELQNELMEKVALSLDSNNNNNNSFSDSDGIQELFVFKKSGDKQLFVIVDAFVSENNSNKLNVVLASSSSSHHSIIHFETVDFDSVIKKSYLRQSSCIMRITKNHHRCHHHQPPENEENLEYNDNAAAVARNPLSRSTASTLSSHFRMLSLLSSSSLPFDVSLMDLTSIISPNSLTVNEFADLLSSVVLSGAKRASQQQEGINNNPNVIIVSSSLPKTISSTPFVHQPQQKPIIFTYSSSSPPQKKHQLTSQILEQLFFSPTKSIFLHPDSNNSNNNKFSPQIFILYDHNICFGETRLMNGGGSDFYFEGLEDHDENDTNSNIVIDYQKRFRSWCQVTGFERRPSPRLLIENETNPFRPKSWSIELSSSSSSSSSVEVDFVSSCLKGMIIVTHRKEDTKWIQQINKKFKNSSSSVLFTRFPLLDEQQQNDDDDDENVIGTDEDFEEDENEDEESKLMKRRRKHARNKKLEELVNTVNSKTRTQQITTMTVFNNNNNHNSDINVIINEPIPKELRSLALIFRALNHDNSNMEHFIFSSLEPSSSSFTSWVKFLLVHHHHHDGKNQNNNNNSSTLEALAIAIENILSCYKAEKTSVRSGYFLSSKKQKTIINKKSDDPDSIKSNDERKKLNTLKLLDNSRTVTFGINSADDLERILLLTCASSSSKKIVFRKNVIIHFKRSGRNNNGAAKPLSKPISDGNIALLTGVTKIVTSKMVTTEWKVPPPSVATVTSTNTQVFDNGSIAQATSSLNTTTIHSRYVFQFRDESLCSFSLSSEELFSGMFADGLILIESTTTLEKETNDHDDDEQEEYDIATDRGMKDQKTLLRLAGEEPDEGNHKNRIIQEIPKRFRKIQLLDESLLFASSSMSNNSSLFINNVLLTVSVAFSQLQVSVSPQELFQYYYSKTEDSNKNCHIEELLFIATSFIENEKKKLSYNISGARNQIMSSSSSSSSSNKNNHINGSEMSPARFGRIKCSKIKASQDFLPAILQALFETSSSSSSSSSSVLSRIRETAGIVELVNEQPVSKKLILAEEELETDSGKNRNENIATSKIGLFIFDVNFFIDDYDDEGDVEKNPHQWSSCIIEGYDAENGIVHVCDVTACCSNNNNMTLGDEKSDLVALGDLIVRSRFGRRWRMTITEMMKSGRRAFGGGDRKDLSFPILVLEKS